jgi:hypothetical protein
MATDIQISHTAAIGRMDHLLLQVRSEGLLGSGIQDLIPGFRPDRRLQRIPRIGAVLMMDPDLNVQNSEIVIGNVLCLGIEPALEELQVDPETSILIYPATARNQGEGKIARGMTAEDGMTEMNAVMTGTG